MTNDNVFEFSFDKKEIAFAKMDSRIGDVYVFCFLIISIVFTAIYIEYLVFSYNNMYDVVNIFVFIFLMIILFVLIWKAISGMRQLSSYNKYIRGKQKFYFENDCLHYQCGEYPFHVNNEDIFKIKEGRYFYYFLYRYFDKSNPPFLTPCLPKRVVSREVVQSFANKLGVKFSKRLF